MKYSIVFLFAFGLLWLPLTGWAAPGVPAVIDTTLPTAGGNIRQFAFDGKAGTFFASARNAGSADHFTLVLDKPVEMKSITVTTGRPDGADRLDAGALEVSADGKSFKNAAKFIEGVARAQEVGAVQAIRIKPTADLQHPLVIREIALESKPAVTIFMYPIEFEVDVSDAPEMKDWADKVVRICERAYPMINEELKSDGFKPRTQIKLRLKKDYRGVAAAGDGRITGSVKYFKGHLDDTGAMVHETVHIVQDYRGKGPGWLVEGIADYLRYFKHEPGKLGLINPKRARYDGSYGVSASFLAYVAEKYDKDLVRKINKRIREGQYKDEVFKELTGKPVGVLDEEWRKSLQR